MINATCPYCELKLEGPYSVKINITLNFWEVIFRLSKDRKRYKVGAFSCPKCGYTEFYRVQEPD